MIDNHYHELMRLQLKLAESESSRIDLFIKESKRQRRFSHGNVNYCNFKTKINRALEKMKIYFNAKDGLHEYFRNDKDGE